MDNPEFNMWFEEHHGRRSGDYDSHPPCEHKKAELFTAWQDGLRVGLQVGDARGTLEFLAKSMKADIIPYRVLTPEEMVLHRLVRRHGLSSPVEFLV